MGPYLGSNLLVEFLFCEGRGKGILVRLQSLDKSFSRRGGVPDDGEAGGEGPVVEVVVVGDGVAEVEDYWLGHGGISWGGVIC